jgi:hypothetical protein
VGDVASLWVKSFQYNVWVNWLIQLSSNTR